MRRRRYVFLGLTITSSWGNGHATTYRALLGALSALGHDVLFLERDVPYYAQNRDLPRPPFGRTELYQSLDDLFARFESAVREASVVVLGSYVPEGAKVGAWLVETAKGVVAFYDLDTPVTARMLERGEHEWMTPDLVRSVDLYLSFTGGPMLDRVRRTHGAKVVKPLYCAADPAVHRPEPRASSWDLGYMGTYSPDRTETLERLLVEPARRLPERRFVVAGSSYPRESRWPANVDRIEHVAPGGHRAFYNGQRFTLNVTRKDMIEAGHSPSVRLFEAAASGTAMLSDAWPGLDEIFEPGREIIVCESGDDVAHVVTRMREVERRSMGRRARERVLREHTARHRALALDGYVDEILGEKAGGGERA